MAFDPSTFNWGLFLLVVSAILIAFWVAAAQRTKPDPIRTIVSLAFLFTACQKAAAPFRGLLDPNYVGFHFGFIGAERGFAVFVTAGSVFCLAVAAAFLALRRDDTLATLVTGLAGVIFFAALGPNVLQALVSEPRSIEMQFGEYLTIPPLGAIPLLLFMLVGYAIAAGLLIRSYSRPKPNTA
jgi:hypothetical protein